MRTRQSSARCVGRVLQCAIIVSLRDPLPAPSSSTTKPAQPQSQPGRSILVPSSVVDNNDRPLRLLAHLALLPGCFTKPQAAPGVMGTLSFLPGRQDTLAFLLPCIPAVPPNGRQRRICPGKGVAAAPNTFQKGLLPLRVDACMLFGRNSPGYISIGYLFSHCSSQRVF